MASAAVWLCLSWATTAALLVVIMRSGLPDYALSLSALDVLKAWCVAASVVLTVPLVRRIAAGPKQAALWETLGIWVIVLGVALVAPSAGGVLWCLLAVTAIGLIVFFSTRTGLDTKSIVALVALGAICAAVHVLTVFGLNYAHPLALEAALSGIQHRDTLFHAAIAAFLVSDGVPSIGLDSLEPLSYHVFSHRFVAGLASWMGTAPINAYSLFTVIIGGPLMVFHLLWAAAVLAQPPRGEQSAVLQMAGLVGWLFVAADLGLSSYWVSESYMVSLWAMLACIVALKIAIQSTGRQAWLALAAVAILVVIASLSKISTGAVLACGVVAGIAVAGKLRLPAICLGFFVGAVPFLWAALWFPVAGSGDPIFGPFAILRDYRNETLFYLLVVVVMTGFAIRYRPKDLSSAAPVVALVVMMWAAITSALLLDLVAGAAFYFADPAVWAALCLIPALGLVPPWMRTGRPVLASALLAAGLAAVLYEADHAADGWTRLGELRTELSETSVEGPGVDEAPARPIERLVDAAATSDAVYVEPGESEFWSLSTPCWAAALTVPAVAGVPYLLGYPSLDSGCEPPTPYYGFGDYTPAPSSLADQDLCAHARERGLVRILMVSPNLDLRHLDCASAALSQTRSTTE